MNERIKELVSYFGLRRKLQDILIFRLSRDEEFLSLSDFNSQYRYIAKLVENYDFGYQERFDLRLDAPKNGDSGRQLHEVIADIRERERRII